MRERKMLFTSIAASLICGLAACGEAVTIVDIPSADATAAASRMGPTKRGAATTPAPNAAPAPTSGASVAALSADAFVNSIGTNVHLSYFDRVYGSGFSTIIKPGLQQLGIRHLRDEAKVVPDDGWMRVVYGRVADLASLGIKFDLVGVPALGSIDYGTAIQFDRLLQFLNPAQVESFEGLNEHDYSGSSAWVSETRSFQAALYARVHGDARLAGIPVLGPSFGRPTNASSVGDLSAYMDFGVMHSYPGGQVPMATYSYNVSSLQPVNGTRSVWATETGYHTAVFATNGQPGVSEEAMGKYVPRLFLEYFGAGAVRTFSYELIDQGISTSDEEMHFGLLRLDGTPKPAYTALRNMIALLADPGPAFNPGGLSYAISGDTVNVKKMLFQKRDGRFYLVLWQQVPSYDLSSKSDLIVPARRLTIALAAAARQANVYIPLQSATPVTQASAVTTLSVDVPDHPLIVELTP